MANPEHLAKLNEGVEAWNQWRKENRSITPDLSRATLIGADLTAADLTEADLTGAQLTGAHLIAAKLNDANLRGAHLDEANFLLADLREVDLSDADLTSANLSRANLTDANLTRADLGETNLVKTNLKAANLTECRVYGISAWDVKLEGAIQANLVITPEDQSAIQVDNLEVAQFVYLLLNNERIRHVINTITSKVVLILGRFTGERKKVLDAIRKELRKFDYVPVLFDFEQPQSKGLTETVTTLAKLARFIIADLTDPSSVPHELAMIIPGTVVPVQTILLDGQREYAMFADLKHTYHWVLEPYKYESQNSLLQHLDDGVIRPAETKATELIRR